MELEKPMALAPSPALRFVFFNERGLRAGWRLLIFAAILSPLWFLSLSTFSWLSGAKGAPKGQAAADSPLWLSSAEMTNFIPVLLATWIMSKIERQKVGTYGLPLAKSALARFVIGYVAWGFLPLTLVLCTLRLLGVFYFGSVSIHGWEAFYWAATWALMFLSVALFEEFLFRGYSLHALADGIGFWPAAIILGVAFARVHMGNGGENRIGIAGVLLFAMFASATLRRTGNLWLAVGAHAGWDWGESFFYGVNNSGFQAPGHLFNPHMRGPDWLSGGSVGPEGSIVTLVFWALMTAVFLLIYQPGYAQRAVSTATDRLAGSKSH